MLIGRPVKGKMFYAPAEFWQAFDEGDELRNEIIRRINCETNNKRHENI